MQLLRSDIPGIQYLVQVLHDFSEHFYVHFGKRTKRAIVRAPLSSLGRKPQHTAVLEAFIQAILYRKTLAHLNELKSL